MKAALIIIVAIEFLVAGCATKNSADDPYAKMLGEQLRRENSQIAEVKKIIAWCDANSQGGTLFDSNTNSFNYTALQVAQIKLAACDQQVALSREMVKTFGQFNNYIQQILAPRPRRAFNDANATSFKPYSPPVYQQPSYSPPQANQTFHHDSRWSPYVQDGSKSPYVQNSPSANTVQTQPPISQPALPNLGSASRYDPNSLANPYGAGSPYKPDGLMNPYSQYGSRYSDKSWNNPYAKDAPKLYDQNGNYLGRFSINRYDSDSTGNPNGRYGSRYSSESINNPYGVGNPYGSPVYVVPQK
jgi:hypothetical protein